MKENAIIVAVKNKQNFQYFDESLDELKDLISFSGLDLKFIVVQKHTQ